jgi:hypothetical protein
MEIQKPEKLSRKYVAMGLKEGARSVRRAAFLVVCFCDEVKERDSQTCSYTEFNKPSKNLHINFYTVGWLRVEKKPKSFTESIPRDGSLGKYWRSGPLCAG